MVQIWSLQRRMCLPLCALLCSDISCTLMCSTPLCTAQKHQFSQWCGALICKVNSLEIQARRDWEEALRVWCKKKKNKKKEKRKGFSAPPDAAVSRVACQKYFHAFKSAVLLVGVCRIWALLNVNLDSESRFFFFFFYHCGVIFALKAVVFFCLCIFFSGESELGIFLDAPENEYTGGVLQKSIRNQASRVFKQEIYKCRALRRYIIWNKKAK